MPTSFLTSLNEQEFKQFLKESLNEILNESAPAKKPLVSGEPMNIEEAAKYLDLEVATLYFKTSKRLIPHFKKGKRLYFHQVELDQWIAEGKVKTQTELEGEAATYILLNKKK